MKRIFSMLLAISTILVMGVPAVKISSKTQAADKIRVSCVGDSITAGNININDPNPGVTLGTISYPRYLQDMLNVLNPNGYEVRNFGRGGAAVRMDDRVWPDSAQYKNSIAWETDYVFFMMGTNDATGDNWANIDSYYKEHYKILIQPYLDMPSKPKVYIVTSPHAYSIFLASTDNLNVKIRNLQLELAEELDLPLIDMNTATSGMSECFPDGLHGNESGYTVIAQTFFKEVFGGKLNEITVNAEPSATVNISTAARLVYTRIIPETGSLKFEALPGTYNFEVRCPNFLPVNQTGVAISDKGVYNFPMTPGDYIVSQWATATCSSTQSGHTADKALNNKHDSDNRWESLYPADGGTTNNEWLLVDLGYEIPNITGVIIFWEGAYASQYKIQMTEDPASDVWTDLAVVNINKAGEVQTNFTQPVTARYIRVHCLARGTGFAFSIYEIRVLASAEFDPPGDKQILETEITRDQAKYTEAELAKYTDMTVDAYIQALNEAKALLETENITKSQVDAAVLNLRNAVKALKIRPPFGIDPIAGIATGFKAGQKPSDYKGYTFKNANGVALASTMLLTTGCTVTYSGEVYTVILKGDTDGDGKITGNDYITAMKLFLEDPATLEMDNVYKLAADADSDGKVMGNDYIVIMKHFLGSINMYD